MKLTYLKTKHYTLLWNLSAIEKDIAERRYAFKIKRMPVVNILGIYYLGKVDWTTVNIGVHPIVAELAKDKYFVMSGGEQIEKAHFLGMRDIYCYYLTPSQQMRYLINHDEKDYRRAVSEYWKDEV